MMFGLLGVVVRIVLRVLLRQGLEYSFASGRTRVNPAVGQGLGLIVAGGVVGVGSAVFLWPVIFSSIIYLIFAGLVVSGLIGGGIIRLAIGLFSVGDTESRSGPAASPVNYYVALPEEMPAGYCWQCGKRVKADSLICLRCGATQPKVAQQRPMVSAPTMERGSESGQWPQWQEGEPPQGPGPMRPGGFPGAAPYPPGMPYPGGAPYPPPPFPPQNMPNMPYPVPGYPAFPLPSRAPFPGRGQRPGGPNPGGPNPGGPFQPGQAPAQGKQPRQKKRSRPRAER